MTMLETLFTDIANAIRGKTGKTDKITPSSFAAEITDIFVGTDTTDATATAGDMLAGETAYVNGQKITGTIPFSESAEVVLSDLETTVAKSTTDNTVLNKVKMTNNYYFSAGQSIAIPVDSSSYGNAAAADVAVGKTFTGADGFQAVGTFDVNVAIENAINTAIGGSY